MFANMPLFPEILMFNNLEKKRPQMKNEVDISNHANINSKESRKNEYKSKGNSINNDYKLIKKLMQPNIYTVNQTRKRKRFQFAFCISRRS